MAEGHGDYGRQNDEQRQRLADLGTSLGAAEWTALLPNGWSVAATFGHLGFWDRMSLALIERYERDGVVAVKNDVPLLNGVLETLFQKMSPEQCRAWALEAAVAVDTRVASLPEKLVAEIIAKDSERRIHRHLHRRGHLDQIEAALRAR